MAVPNPQQFPATHPEWEAVLARIARHPQDDLTRLIAADWLDDHADQFPDAAGPVSGLWSRRAELIRVQVAHAQSPSPELARRADVLLGPWNVDRVVWAAEACPQLVRLQFPHLSLLGGSAVAFRRGFAEVITCSVTEWVAHGRAILARQPVRVLNLRRATLVPASLWWEVLATLRTLDAVTAAGADEFTARWLSEHLPPGVYRPTPAD